MKERVAEHTQRKYKQSSLLAGTEQKRKNRNLMLQNVVFTGILVAVFFLAHWSDPAGRLLLWFDH